jgi:lipoyl(octanoyl) transferase
MIASDNPFARAEWRLLITPPADGARNMAIDEAILEASTGGEALPTLRLYAWVPPCLSLGYAQPVAEVDLPRLASFGWDLVRRPTGGRAILHTDELTYSVLGPQIEPRLAGGVLESYFRLSQALLHALHLLDVPAQAQEKSIVSPSPTPVTSGTSSTPPICFEVPSSYEITAGGKKLIGSAQARRKSGVMQHGSLPLCGDLTRITQALIFANEGQRHAAAVRLLARATTLEDVLNRKVSWETATQAFINAFQEVLTIELQPAGLTPLEESRADELVAEKYADAVWTFKI